MDVQAVFTDDPAGAFFRVMQAAIPAELRSRVSYFSLGVDPAGPFKGRTIECCVQFDRSDDFFGAGFCEVEGDMTDTLAALMAINDAIMNSGAKDARTWLLP